VVLRKEMRQKVICNCGKKMKSENIQDSIQERWVCDCGEVSICCVLCFTIRYKRDFKKAVDLFELELCNECGTDCISCRKRYHNYLNMLYNYDTECRKCEDCYFQRERWMMNYFTVALGCNYLIPKSLNIHSRDINYNYLSYSPS
jgi:hypothetical protein